MIKEINNEFLQKIYKLFTFKYFQYSCINENLKNNVENAKNKLSKKILLDYIKDFKFLTLIKYRDSKFYSIYAVICIEKQCILIEQAYDSFFNEIIEKSNEHNLSIIDVSAEFTKNRKNNED